MNAGVGLIANFDTKLISSKIKGYKVFITENGYDEGRCMMPLLLPALPLNKK